MKPRPRVETLKFDLAVSSCTRLAIQSKVKAARGISNCLASYDLIVPAVSQFQNLSLPEARKDQQKTKSAEEE
jgi:hypothetical protein